MQIVVRVLFSVGGVFSLNKTHDIAAAILSQLFHQPHAICLIITNPSSHYISHLLICRCQCQLEQVCQRTFQLLGEDGELLGGNIDT